MMSPDAPRPLGSSDTRSPSGLLASLPTSPRVAESVYDCGQEGHHPRITRPEVLLVVGHPSIGAALEALLRIEDRYEVRRAQSLEQVASGLDGWTADLALVDGVLVAAGRTEVLPMPTIVLSGNPHDGRRLAERFAQGQGWLRKDATAEEIRAAIDRALASGARRWSATIVMAVLLLAGVWVVVAWGPLPPRGGEVAKTARRKKKRPGPARASPLSRGSARRTSPPE